MKFVRAILFSAVCLFLFTDAQAQKENNVWHFGNGAGVDFNFSPPRAIESPFVAVIEGSATVCDPVTGELLISTDGTTVWNGELQIMPNGTGLLGGFGTSTQGALILPFPRKENLYYIFTCDQAGYAGPNQGVKYSVVDMTLDGGRGDVTLKNIDVFAPQMTEKLTAIPHANSCDFWVIAHAKSRDFMAIRVSDTIVGNPVISSVGHLVGNGTLESIGYLVSNAAGTMLAYVTEDASAWIYDFDPATGIVSDPKPIYASGDHLYGVSFSPDGTKLYVGSYFPGQLMQFDVTLATANEIGASRKVIYSDPSIAISAIRPGPDGKLYAGMWGSQTPSYLGVINDPNQMGVACNFDPQGLELLWNTSVQLGLPNVLDAWVNRPMQPCLVEEPEPVSIEPELGTFCAGDCLEFAEVGAGSRKVVWRVSDGRTFESIATPSICFDSAGVYSIDLLAIGNRGDTTYASTITVTILPALNFKLQSYAVVTDTIGAVIKVPIVLSERVTSTFNASFSFDPNVLEYAGAYDDAGTPIDAGSQPENGEIVISRQLNGDTTAGYLYFNLYWESASRCRSIQLNGYSLSNTSLRCLSNDVSYEMCLDEACGTPILSQYLRSAVIDLSLAPNPATTSIMMCSSTDISSGEVVMIDAEGKNVLKMNLYPYAGVPLTIDVSGLNNGVYFLSFFSEKGIVRKSVVIKR